MDCSYFRAKMGTHPKNLKGLHYPEIFDIETSFLLVMLSNNLDFIVASIELHQRDYDILEQPLGTFSVS